MGQARRVGALGVDGSAGNVAGVASGGCDKRGEECYNRGVESDNVVFLALKPL